MTDRLKPCPFCGGDARITDVFGRTGIVCEECFAEMRGYLDITPEEMSRYWNTRKPMDRIVEQIEGMFGVDPIYYGEEAKWAVDKAIEIIKEEV